MKKLIALIILVSSFTNAQVYEILLETKHHTEYTPEQIEKSGFDKYYVDHTLALWPQAASGTPWSATTFQSKGDPITDLHEDMAAEGAIV